MQYPHYIPLLPLLFLMCNYSSEEGVEEVSSEPSLAEMFEQIRHCRYIRHYHPDGTALEEYYWLSAMRDVMAT